MTSLQKKDHWKLPFDGELNLLLISLLKKKKQIETQTCVPN